MERALSEVKRRREYQLKYNALNDITPKSVVKPFRDKMVELTEVKDSPWLFNDKEPTFTGLSHVEVDALTPMERKRLVKNLNTEMKIAAQDLDFELAIEIRDKIKEIDNGN